MVYNNTVHTGIEYILDTRVVFYSDSQIFRVSMALADRYPSQTTSILLFNITKVETSIGLFTIPLRKYHNSKDQPVIFQPINSIYIHPFTKSKLRTT
jgi:hypothetical protein